MMSVDMCFTCDAKCVCKQ